MSDELIRAAKNYAKVIKYPKKRNVAGNTGASGFRDEKSGTPRSKHSELRQKRW
jgi:hypothetical protein